ncbi:MAG: HAMP domain-containing histidine kinase, partial [Myxococcales bacterium]|nr:HAMP domain-containing histidine kinase [Myxococcales bacterium]
DLRFDREAREEALAAALAHGFSIRPVARPTEPGEPASVRLPSGHVELAVALAPSEVAREPAARVRYAAELASNITAIGAVILLFSVAAAALIGRAFGTALASDLVLASQRVASLGTEAASHAADPTAERSRFAVVAELDDSVARLASRFSEFAAAQRRALRARAAAQRVKQLLFASVSHDLKNPLNAILGFAELVREEPLSSAQLESLEMVVSRGRELLRLIETILDAARVEAGQLKLAKERTSASVLVNLALEIARELVAERGSDVLVELPRDLPALSVDRTRGPLALAALIAHAMASARASSGGAVRIRGSGGKDGGGPRIWIEHADGHGQPALLASQLTGRSPSARDRGLVLRLSLARAVIELHGGRVEVGRGQRRESVVTCYWPAASGDS